MAKERVGTPAVPARGCQPACRAVPAGREHGKLGGPRRPSNSPPSPYGTQTASMRCWCVWCWGA